MFFLFSFISLVILVLVFLDFSFTTTGAITVGRTLAGLAPTFSFVVILIWALAGKMTRLPHE